MSTTPFGDSQCTDEFLGRRCEELLNHDGAHQVRVCLMGPDYGVDYIEVWPNLKDTVAHERVRGGLK